MLQSLLPQVQTYAKMHTIIGKSEDQGSSLDGMDVSEGKKGQQCRKICVE